jgi:hypothetical protein
MYSNLAEKNKYNCLKLHHVGYLTNIIKFRVPITISLFLFARLVVPEDPSGLSLFQVPKHLLGFKGCGP